MRAHLYRTVFKSDSSGPLDPGALVRVLQPGSSTVITDPLFADGSSSTTLNNPFSLAGATLDFYLDTPQRVDLGITPVGASGEFIVQGQDVILPRDDISAREALPFSFTGALVVTTGTSRLYIERASVISLVRASVGTSPSGASVIVDVKKNGASIFTDPSHRPAIVPGAYTALAPTIDTSGLAPGDYLTVDVAQVGSTVPGSDLTVVLEVTS